MLNEAERQCVQSCNADERPFPKDRSIPDLVHAQSLASPEAPAVVAGARTLTYRELDERANDLAADLRTAGVGRDVVVGVCADRSAEMIVGALAVLKAGGAYLPLDPSYPPERSSFILSDARCPLILLGPAAGRVGEERAAHGTAARKPLDLDGPRAANPPAPAPRARDLAYVIYTSGSTGRPKGVEISHESLLNLVFWHQRVFEVRSTDRASQVASVGFDAAVWEVWPYLAAGASIHMPDDAARTDPEALRDWLVAHRITIGFVPTPMAERLIGLKWPAATSLRWMLTGGDTLHAYPAPELPFVLVNNYGPTECTVVATSGIVHPYEQPERRPTIGKPIDNTEIHILDEAMQEVTPGVAGEVYIGGVGVARGYRNQPELTAARFLEHPRRQGGRLYKTGDLARRLPDGQIAFVGRSDDQIKIRGFRIEPNEIVAALNRHPAVAGSAVVAGDLGGGEKRLVAYVVPAIGARPTHAGLQDALRVRLPEYMVPAVFVQLPALPLGAHGKIDRAAPPEPNPTNTLRDSEMRVPQTQVEECVAGLVKSLLRVDRLGVDDNFFLVGGHSLFGTQLIARIGDEFGVDVSLRDVFDAPTVAQLSAKIERLLVEKIDAMSEDETRSLLHKTGQAVAS